jgi:ABC-2 type transport system ATP-binding protein
MKHRGSGSRTSAVNQLVIDSLTKRYHHLAAIEPMTLSLEPGIIGLLGPNGAGKSTLMRIIATVAKPTSGSILWNGTDTLREPDALRQQLGYLPQDAGVYPQLSADEFLRYIAALKGLSARAASKQIDALIEQLNLQGARSRPLGGFSGGMRQRVCIAQALLGNPQLLVIDEPTVGLDPEERVRFRNLIVELGRDRIVLLSTHIVSDVEIAAGRIIILCAGRVCVDGTPAAVIGTHENLESAYLAYASEARAA